MPPCSDANSLEPAAIKQRIQLKALPGAKKGHTRALLREFSLDRFFGSEVSGVIPQQSWPFDAGNLKDRTEDGENAPGDGLDCIGYSNRRSTRSTTALASPVALMSSCTAKCRSKDLLSGWENVVRNKTLGILQVRPIPSEELTLDRSSLSATNGLFSAAKTPSKAI